MYESFFHFQARPFHASPMADRYYPASSIEQARETIVRCVDRAEGPAVVMGAAGMGKSMLCQVLAQRFRDRFRVAMLASARLCTRRALLQNILFELKQPYRDREEGELRLSLVDFLEPSDTCRHGMLLLVDEAHMLPLRLLEEIRMLTNLVRDGQSRVRVVMAASLAMDERLGSPRLESFNQRIAARCYLQSMNRDETLGYVAAQIKAVGGVPEKVFTPDALQAVYRATDGVPRLVNQVCDHVLVMAAVGQQAPVTATGIEEAWADLQQLPVPWASGEPAAAAREEGETGILEFGQLDDPGTTCEVEVGSDDMLSSSESVEPSVTARLEEIESGISALDAELAEPGVQPAERADTSFTPLTSKPEIELIFHQAHDPFSEPFEDEEVVADPYAEPAAPSPSSPADRPSQAAAEHGDSSVSSLPTIPLFESQESTPASIGASPGSATPVRQAVAASMSDAAGGEVKLPGDDRDLLDIYDDLHEQREAQTLAMLGQPPRRRAYRQLFANLRRR